MSHRHFAKPMDSGDSMIFLYQEDTTSLEQWKRGFNGGRPSSQPSGRGYSSTFPRRCSREVLHADPDGSPSLQENHVKDPFIADSVSDLPHNSDSRRV